MPLHRSVTVAVLALSALACVAPAAASGQPSPSGPSAAVMPKRLRIALVPLDDRPVCLQYPQMMARLAHAEVVAPPPHVLGRFTTPGDTAAIAAWLRAQDWRTIDALIVSTDMLAYGGLVASRVRRVEADISLARLGVLREIRKAHPSLAIYGFSVLMRLAPTADGTNEAYRETLARWAEIAADPRSAAERAEIAALEAAIPPTALADYRGARVRNREVNLAAVQLVSDRVIDFLVVSQDDAKPRGAHVADRAAVTASASDKSLTGHVGVQPGADEVAMLLLSRAVLTARQLMPAVRTTFSSEAARTMIAPFEDRPLHETVAFQLTAAGAAESRTDDTPALDLFVFASRHEPGVPQAFANTIVTAVQGGARAVVADVDPKGDVQGASPAFTEPLLAAKVFAELYGYASWNTAGNTLGTAIPHALLAWAGATLATRCTSPAFTAMTDARVTFLLHRLVNDYAWQGMLRPVLNRELRDASRDAAWVRAHEPELSARIRESLAPALATYAGQFSPGYMPPAPGVTDLGVQVDAPRNLQVRLPWSRTFEAAITFDVGVTALSGPARRLPLCTDPPR